MFGSLLWTERMDAEAIEEEEIEDTEEMMKRWIEKMDAERISRQGADKIKVMDAEDMIKELLNHEGIEELLNPKKIKEERDVEKILNEEEMLLNEKRDDVEKINESQRDDMKEMEKMKTKEEEEEEESRDDKLFAEEMLTDWTIREIIIRFKLTPIRTTRVITLDRHSLVHQSKEEKN